MSAVADVVIIVIASALFGYTHSLLASRKVKQFAARIFGDLIAFYRITYNLLSFISLYVLYQLLPAPSLVIYDLPTPWDLLVLIPQLVGLAGFIWSTKYFSLWEFIGISQIKKWANGNYNMEDLDEKLTFKEEGPYRYMRHPLYFFAIIFLLFRPFMDLFYLTLFLCAAAYFYIGAIYEERKLEQEFGEAYADYKKRVPRIIPLKFRER